MLLTMYIISTIICFGSISSIIVIPVEKTNETLMMILVCGYVGGFLSMIGCMFIKMLTM